MKEKGILFDYNGVIVSDEPLQEKAMAEAVAPYGVALTPELYKEHCLGRTDREGFTRVQQAFPEQLSSVTVDHLIEKKVKHYERITETESVVVPRLKETLEELRKTYRMGVVTGSLRSEVSRILSHEDLTKYFEFVITAEDVTRGKPNPEGYLKGLDAIGLPASSVVVIEDTPVGIQAAKDAGLRCIAVAQTVSADALGEADTVLQNVSELTSDIIEQLHT